MPKTLPAMKAAILASRVAIQGKPLYYYNRLTGTRWLTLQSFETLRQSNDSELATHLRELSQYLGRPNRLNKPEMALFSADLGTLEFSELNSGILQSLPPADVRERYNGLCDRFRSLVHPAFRTDNPEDKVWCKRMIQTLFLEGSDTQTEQMSRELAPEYFLQVSWLPGGRFEEGEFLFDPIFEEAWAHPDSKELDELCDLTAKGIIFNLIREHGDIEYINVARIKDSLSKGRPQIEGRRGVYLAEFKSRSELRLIRRVIRMQKWGVREQLDQGKDLLQAIKDSDDYTEYWLDRRLGCRQLGMNLSRRVLMRLLSELYYGSNHKHHGELIRTSYFEREFVPGTATDKLPPEKYVDPEYSSRLAELLGQAAAVSMIVGRAFENGTEPIFDDGDELICEDDNGMPMTILVADHSGAFGEYQRPLDVFAEHYAKPVNSRAPRLKNAVLFGETYLKSFRQQFIHTQHDYRIRRRAFDTLFKHCRYDPNGSFAYRWERVLARLERTDADELVASIRRHVKCLNAPDANSVVLKA